MKFRRNHANETSAAPLPEQGPQVLNDGGLLATWYIARRLDEELARAHRCDRPIAVLLPSPQLLPGEVLPPAAKDAAAAAVLRATRRYDLVGWLPDGHIIVIMPETRDEEAAAIADRLRNEMFRCSSGVGGHKWSVHEIPNARSFETSLALLASVASPSRAA